MRKRKTVILISVGIASILLNLFGTFGVCVLTLRFDIYLLLSVVLCAVPIAIAAFIGQRKASVFFGGKNNAFRLAFFCPPLAAVPLFILFIYIILRTRISDSFGYLSLLILPFALDLTVFVLFCMLEGFAYLLKGEK